MSMITLFLGKLIGLYLVAISVAMLSGKRRTLATLDDMANNGPWMLFSGMVATAVGLAIVLAHNVWTSGALAVAITLVGWAALLKGLLLLFVPRHVMAKAYKSMGLERYFHLWMGVVLVIGFWITLKAFTA